MPPDDPYKTLGARPNISDAELRKVYRRLVLANHPDHNNGSEESERRFEEIQAAYARIRAVRASGPARGSGPSATAGARASAGGPPPGADPDLEARLARMEAELHEAQKMREQAEAAERAARVARDQAAREARRAAAAGPGRPSDEELGYYSTDDSFSKILADVRDELSDRLGQAREHPVARRVADLIDELDGLVDRERRHGGEH
jgi:hypothetical protein